MKQILFFGLGLIAIMASCKKGDSLPATKPIDTHAGVDVGNTTNYNGYVVKSIAVSRLVLSADANDKLTVAEMYGGGNKIVLKPGTGNKIEMVRTSTYETLPKELGPDGFFGATTAAIDNGKPADTLSTGQVFKIRGFDKSKTGYDQLNIVFYKMVRPQKPGSAGFFTNVSYIDYNIARSNKEYSEILMKSFFSGDIKVVSVETAQPLANNPYVVEDQVVYKCSANTTSGSLTSNIVELSSNTFTFIMSKNLDYNFSFGGPFKYEWVNADKGTTTKFNDKTYFLNFDNIVPYDHIIEPADTTNKVFLRVSGFDKSVTGFNQLRLFIAYRGQAYGAPFTVRLAEKPAATLSFKDAKNVFLPAGLVCNNAEPVIPHY
jgi:hypothetical protein